MVIKNIVNKLLKSARICFSMDLIHFHTILLAYIKLFFTQNSFEGLLQCVSPFFISFALSFYIKKLFNFTGFLPIKVAFININTFYLVIIVDSFNIHYNNQMKDNNMSKGRFNRQKTCKIKMFFNLYGRRNLQ